MTDKDLRSIRMPSGALLNRVRAVRSTRAEAAAARDKAVAEAAAAKAAQEAKDAAKAAEAEKAKEAKRAAKLKAQPPVTVYDGPENPTFDPAPEAAPKAPKVAEKPETPKPAAPAQVKETVKPPPARIRQRVIPAKAGAYTKNLWLFVWIIIAVGAAQAALYINPLVGVYAVAVALASLLWLAIKLEKARHLLISVALIPLTMLVSLSLPQTTVFARTTETMVILLVLGLVYQYLFTTDYQTEGTRMRMTRHGYLFAIPLMVVLGQFLGLIGFGLLHNQYDFSDSSLVLVALGAVVFAIAEEIVFRGLIQQRAMLLFHPVMAAVLSAALFAALSFGHRGGILSPVFGILLGSVLAIVYYKKQNILLTISVNVAAKLTYVGLVGIFILRG